VILEEKMRKLLFAATAAVLVAGTVFAGGGGDKGGAASSATFIGIAMPETHVLRWIKDGASLKQFAEARGFRAQDQYANADQNLQNTQIENFLTQNAKAIIIGCVNDGVAAAVAGAARDKVTVIAYDRIIPNSADYDY
jgi:putative multiple sugar transport system substrate-binding protein